LASEQHWPTSPGSSLPLAILRPPSEGRFIPRRHDLYRDYTPRDRRDPCLEHDRLRVASLARSEIHTSRAILIALSVTPTGEN